MSRFVSIIIIVGQIVSLGACAVPNRQLCAPGVGAPMTVFTLYLGTAIPGRGNLTETEWRSFLDDTVTADLPNGYTILDASGAWMNPITRKTIKEATKVLIAALPETPESLVAVDRIRRDYQLKFRQQLVGMTVEQVCGTF
jgi:hypothetical protein